MVLGEAKNLNAIVVDRYGGGGDTNNEVQMILASTLASISTYDDPTGGGSGMICIMPQAGCCDENGFLYSSQRNSDQKFTRFAVNTRPLSLVWDTGRALPAHAKWIPDANGVPRLIVVSADTPAVVNVFSTLPSSDGSVSLSFTGNLTSPICSAIDGRNHLWVFNQTTYGGATSDGTLDEVDLSGFGVTSYTLSGTAGFGAFRSMWYSPADQTLVFLTALGYLVKWNTVTHAVVSSVLVSELAGIGGDISADMAKNMTNVNTGKLWMTQNDGFTLASYDLITLAINAADTINLRVAFAGIPNFSGTWINKSPCAYLPYTRAFVGWDEPGGNNHYTWYVLSRPATATSIALSADALVHPFGTPFVLTAAVTGVTPTGTVTFEYFQEAIPAAPGPGGRPTRPGRNAGWLPLGSATLVAGVATLDTPTNWEIGVHTVRATYNGDYQNGVSISSSLALTVVSAQTIANSYGTGSHSTTKSIKAHNQKYWFNEEQQRKLRHK